MESARLPSRGGFSVRGIIAFALAVVMTALLWLILSPTPTQAQSSDASWNGASLRHEDRDYYQVGRAAEGEVPGIPADSRYYVATPDSSSPSANKAHVIYLKPGTDPPGDGTATYALYDYNATTRELTNPTNVRDITVDVDSINAQSTTCSIESVGWIVCPVMNFLAWGMDTVFNLIAEFMEVQPLETGNADGSLFNAWNIVRGIANIALIIVFLIIIYAQLTSVAISSYGIKRMLPRLVIAAIAINLSYIIVAIGVDVSNILGWSIHEMLVNLRNDLLSTGVTNSDNIEALGQWESVTGFVLSGGTALAAGTIGVVAIAGNVTAAVFLLLPALVGLLLAILVVLLILAARQALIVILAIVAPLAIVAYLLPNTEQWFKKWRGLLMTLLIFFPAFAFVFGGSQLAGAIIIQNATSINVLILGLIVQAAPLVITPLLLKLSGSVLGGIARLVNDPNRGFIDRTRNWAKPRAEQHIKNAKANIDRNGNQRLDKNGQPKQLPYGIRRTSRYFDQRTKRLSDRTANADSALQTGYEESDRYKKNRRLIKRGEVKYDMAAQKAYFEDRKKIAHSDHEAHVNKLRHTKGSPLFQTSTDVSVAENRAKFEKNEFDRLQNKIKSDERFAARVGATALFTSSRTVEVSNDKLQVSENRKTAYYDIQRATSGTQLSRAAMTAQSSKEHLEGAQNTLQTFFNTQRSTEDGNVLNVSTRDLTQSKVRLEKSQSNVEAYIQTIKSTQGTSLHLDTVSADRAKRDQQIAESNLNRILEQYRAGGEIDAATGNRMINEKVATAQESALAEAMVRQTEDLAAQARGIQAGQNMQKKAIAEAFRERVIDPVTGERTEVKTARAQQLLAIARSIDPEGAVRAESDAISTLEKILADARSANETLLEERAVESNLTPKDFAVKLLENRLKGDPSESEEIIRAAMEIAGKEAQIPILRKIRRDTVNFNQEHLTSMILRNSGTMKAKGAFDLQANLDLIGASEEMMDASIADTLGSVAPDKIFDLKNGALKDYVANFGKIIPNTMNLAREPETTKEGQAGRKGLVGLRKTYANLHTALSDPEIVRTLGDNLSPSIKMYRILHAQFNDSAKALSDDYLNGIDPEYLP